MQEYRQGRDWEKQSRLGLLEQQSYLPHQGSLNLGLLVSQGEPSRRGTPCER